MIFIWGGGGAQKMVCANAHYEHETQSPFWQGSQGPRKGPGLAALGFFMLSCTTRAYF